MKKKKLCAKQGQDDIQWTKTPGTREKQRLNEVQAKRWCHYAKQGKQAKISVQCQFVGLVFGKKQGIMMRGVTICDVGFYFEAKKRKKRVARGYSRLSRPVAALGTYVYLSATRSSFLGLFFFLFHLGSGSAGRWAGHRHIPPSLGFTE